MKNQTVNGVPAAATINGDESKGGILSFLPGQKLSRCTCSGENHPGPKHSDGTFVGRAAPEIDILEAQVSLFWMSSPPCLSNTWRFAQGCNLAASEPRSLSYLCGRPRIPRWSGLGRRTVGSDVVLGVRNVGDNASRAQWYCMYSAVLVCVRSDRAVFTVTSTLDVRKGEQTTVACRSMYQTEID